MLRFGGRYSDGRKLIGMVLSRENLERLKGGDPVLVDGATVGADDVVVMIHVTDTPQADLGQMVRDVIGRGGDVRSIEEVLEEREAVRAIGGDPDADPQN